MRRVNGFLLRKYQLPIARKILRGEYRKYCAALPRKSGKSFLGFYIANGIVIRDKDRIVHGLIIAKEKGQTKRIYVKNIMEDGRSLFDLLPPGAKYSKYDSEIVYPNGSTIEFNGIDNMESILGGRFDFIICDEFATWDEDKFNELYPCLRDEINSTLIIISTVRGKNHFWQKLKRFEENSLWLTQHTNVIELGLMTQQEYDDNPMDANYKAQEFMCDVESSFMNAVYSRPNLDKNLYIPNCNLYIGVDLGKLKDATSFVAAQIVDNKIRIVFILKFIGIVSGDIIASVKSHLQKLNHSLNKVKFFLPHDSHIRNDLSGLSRLEHFRQEGFDCYDVPFKGVVDGIDLVRSFWHTMVFDEDTCKEGIEDIKAYRSDENGKPDISTKNHKFSHVPDALRYLCIGMESYDIIKGWRIQYDIKTEYEGVERYNIYSNRFGR